MTKGKYDTKEKPIHPEIGALFGHLVICNNQLHDFQNKIIKEYFSRKEIDYSYFHDVAFFKEGSITFKKAIEFLKDESPKIQRELYYYLVIVSEIDGITDNDEEMFFSNFTDLINIENIDSVKDTATKKAVNERKNLKKENSVNHTGKRGDPNSQYNIFRITQEEYVNAINKCREIAEKDYKEVKPIAEDIVRKGNNFYHNLESKAIENPSFHPEVGKALKGFAQSVENEIVNQAKEYQTQINRKGSSVSDFTIALIGRTKAGKSTLRAVLTGEGKENIGHGAQRTTRINDIYEWNNLRIIDTPGIDAGSDTENVDQRIAEEVIGEADVICFIAADDGLPKNAREFAVSIAKRNKPVIMLVNHKSNIHGGTRLRRFIEEPLSWKNADESNKIEGYFEPIKRMAEEQGVSSLIKYQSVFLLAELLSKENEYADYKKQLNDGSGINEFLAELKYSVVYQGSFLRSKTIIDDTTSVCGNWINELNIIIEPLKSIRDELKCEKDKAITKINKAQSTLLKHVESEVINAFDELATTYANEFASEYAFEKKGLTEKWESYCESIGINEKLKNRLNSEFSTFTEELSDIINDLFEDLQFMPINSKYNVSKLKMVNAPLRELFRGIGGVVGLAGSILVLLLESNPIGWILTGVGAVIGIVAQLFKSKAERQKRAKDKLYNKIHDSVIETKDVQVNKIIEQLKEESNSIVNDIITLYDNLLDGLDYSFDACDELIADMESNINDLNCLFAQRIIEYISGKSVIVTNVDRHDGIFSIYTTEDIEKSECNFSKIEGLLNETIMINNQGVL